MNEQQQLLKSELAQGMLELKDYIAPKMTSSVQLVLNTILLKAIHKAYTLGGKECLKIIKG